jgi:hypothetical protein
MASPEHPPASKPRRAAPKKASTAQSTATKQPAAARSSKAKKIDTPQRVDMPRELSAEERYRMTEVAAYFMAERNNFSGNPVEYWQAAESQISQMLGQR